MRSNEFDSALIDRYLAGELSDQESTAVEEWLARHPAEKNKVLGIRSVAAERFGPIPSYDVDARVAAIVDFGKRSARRVHEEAGAYRILANQGYANRATSTVPGIQRRWAGKYLYAVAGCVLAIGLVTFGALKDWGSSMKAEPKAFSVYTTNPGERATITLPDSSTVILSVASRLEVPIDYGQHNRTLRLRGEAFFTVTQSAGNPFTVIAGPSTTRVLGTRFTVRHYPTDSTATIAVRDGKVSVQSKTLTALQQVVVSDDGQAHLRQASTGQFSFANGVLTLEDQRLPQAIQDLNRWYNVDIRVSDTTLNKMFIVGEFASGSITDLMEILQRTLDVRVERNGRILTLYSRDRSE